MLQTTQKLILKLLDHPKYTLSFLAAVTIILGSYLPGLKMDFTIEQLFSQNDPVIERFMTFREEFAGVDNIVFLIYESDNPFSHTNLVKNRQMVENLAEIEGVESVPFLYARCNPDQSLPEWLLLLHRLKSYNFLSIRMT